MDMASGSTGSARPGVSRASASRVGGSLVRLPLSATTFVVGTSVKIMASGPAQPPAPAPSSRAADGILIGDRLYSQVHLTIDNSLIPDERLSPTPSMVDGLDLNSETDLRVLGCEMLQSAGILLRLPQVAMATGQVLFHRFFYSKSFVKHSFEIVAMACINLASKIEEAPRRIRDVINVFHHLRQLRGKRTASPLILDQNYINTKNQVIKAERRILKELGFCVHVKHPHKIIVMYLQVLECERNETLVQTAWNYMNDCLRTNVFVRFQPETIACACIYLAARALQPNYELLEKEVEKRKVALQEAKLKAKGLNPDGTPALSNMGGFSPSSKPSSPREIKVEEKSPVSMNVKMKKESEDGQPKSPFNGLRKDVKRSKSTTRSRTRSRSHSPRRRFNNRRSRSGTYSSRSRSRSGSHSGSPRRRHTHGSPHLKVKHRSYNRKNTSRHGHKRKKSRSRSHSKSRDYSDALKKHRHDQGHHRYRHERSRSSDRSHKSKHHSSGRSGHSRHRR
ncbi:cyclin-L1 isoform X2 [Ambystoma mexicanum]|uniref:cyclin-L1 isoform X2 n=1 Tax=Ambystoma mexicanum TaxID=8296 RepID=UPI0037E93B97